MAHSLCFGAFAHGKQKQIGIARIITDRATYAYICNVCVEPERRGQGTRKALMAAIRNHPELQNLRRWSLVTRDAHGLYAQFGFAPPAEPSGYMEIVRRNADVGGHPGE
jgi:N-acetylglutamate synthase-like GNAT family acetyltransferase